MARKKKVVETTPEITVPDTVPVLGEGIAVVMPHPHKAPGGNAKRATIAWLEARGDEYRICPATGRVLVKNQGVADDFYKAWE